MSRERSRQPAATDAYPLLVAIVAFVAWLGIFGLALFVIPIVAAVGIGLLLSSIGVIREPRPSVVVFSVASVISGVGLGMVLALISHWLYVAA